MQRVHAPDMPCTALATAIRRAASIAEPRKAVRGGFLYIDGKGDRTLMRRLQRYARGVGRNHPLYSLQF